MADSFRDVSKRHAFFGDCVVSSTCLLLFKSVSIEMGNVEDVRRWPAIESLGNVSGDALFSGNGDKKGDEPLSEGVVDLWDAYHIHRYTLLD
jgi:hypothetical protein